MNSGKNFLPAGFHPIARDIMEALRDSSPQVTRGLKLATGTFTREERGSFDKAITELQSRMFIVKVAEQADPFSFVWAPFTRAFASQVRRARHISPETARQKLLERYFQNQFIGSVDTIQNLFRWGKTDDLSDAGEARAGWGDHTEREDPWERQALLCPYRKVNMSKPVPKVIKAYNDFEFLNSPDARVIRMLAEFLGPQTTVPARACQGHDRILRIGADQAEK